MHSDNSTEQENQEQQTLPILQANSRTISLSYNKEETAEINKILEELQTKQGYSSTTMKGLFLEILRNSTNAVENSNEIQSEIHQNSIIELQTKIGILEEEKAQIQEDLDEIQKNPIKETVEIEKEVEKKLPPNSIVVELSDNELLILDAVAENRAKKLKNEQESRSKTLHDLALNKSSVFNWGGGFYTGLG